MDRLIKEGFTWVVDADLASYFDSIPHERLMERVAERISDGRVLGLTCSWLGQDILRGMERWTPTTGTPQGAVISPLLANIYLHPLDEVMAAHGYQMVRYADDFVVLCASREAAEAALAEIRAWVAENGLSLHPDKTHVGDCRQPGRGFDFLGYRFEAGTPVCPQEEPHQSQGQHPSEDAADARAEPGRGSSPISTRCCEAGSATLSTPILIPSYGWTSSFADGCAPSCASRRSGPASDDVSPTINAGPTPSSRKSGCSPFTRPGLKRDTPDEETTDWRAVCGKTARTVRRAGRAKTLPRPLLFRDADPREAISTCPSPEPPMLKPLAMTLPIRKRNGSARHARR